MAEARAVAGVRALAPLKDGHHHAAGAGDNSSGDHCQICRLRGKRRASGYYCTTCHMPLCRMCCDQHMATKVTKGHKVIPKGDQDKNSRVCPAHRFATIQYFCDTCCQLICVNCTMIEHRGHDVIGIDRKFEECRNTIKATMDELDRKISLINVEIKRIDDVQSGIEQTREKVKVDINSQVVALQQKIKAQQEQLLRRLDGYLDSKSDYLSKKKEILNQRFEDMMAMRMSTDFVRSDVTEDKFITDAIRVQRQVQELKVERQLKEEEFAGLQFVMTNNEEVGKLEESGESMMLTKVPRLKNAPEPGTLRAAGGKSVRSSHPSVAGRDPQLIQKYLAKKPDPLAQVSAEPVNFGDWQRLKIVNKFKTATFVQKLSGLAILPNGKLVLTDAASHGLVICDRSGRFQQRMLIDELPYPSGLAIDKDGRIVVSSDKYIKTFKVGGSKVGQMKSFPAPCALAVDPKGNLLVNDPKSRHVTIFDVEGQATRKFATTDKLGNAPDAYNLAIGEECVALTHSSFGLSHTLNSYSYEGKLLHSVRLPDACQGVQIDSFGNMVLASGDLCLAPGMAATSVVALRCMDRSGKIFKLMPHGVALTPGGQICTLHVNQHSRRSEIVFLQLGN